jgi:TetR/AcrR family transcriptional regulator, repressor of fatR-cypB operon
MTEIRGDILFDAGDPPSKREILRHALSLFVRNGLCETSIRDIGQAAGYTNPALYKFFAGKDELALHLFQRCFEHVTAVVASSQETERPFAERLRALTRAFAALVDESNDVVLYANETLRTFWPRLPAAARRRSLLGELRQMVEGGLREGAIPADTHAELAVALLVGTMAQVARMFYFGELAVPAASHVEALTELLGRALTGPLPS